MLIESQSNQLRLNSRTFTITSSKTNQTCTDFKTYISKVLITLDSERKVPPISYSQQIIPPFIVSCSQNWYDLNQLITSIFMTDGESTKWVQVLYSIAKFSDDNFNVCITRDGIWYKERRDVRSIHEDDLLSDAETQNFFARIRNWTGAILSDTPLPVNELQIQSHLSILTSGVYSGSDTTHATILSFDKTDDGLPSININNVGLDVLNFPSFAWLYDMMFSTFTYTDVEEMIGFGRLIVHCGQRFSFKLNGSPGQDSNTFGPTMSYSVANIQRYPYGRTSVTQPTQILASTFAFLFDTERLQEIMASDSKSVNVNDVLLHNGDEITQALMDLEVEQSDPSKAFMTDDMLANLTYDTITTSLLKNTTLRDALDSARNASIKFVNGQVMSFQSVFANVLTEAGRASLPSGSPPMPSVKEFCDANLKQVIEYVAGVNTSVNNLNAFFGGNIFTTPGTLRDKFGVMRDRTKQITLADGTKIALPDLINQLSSSDGYDSLPTTSSTNVPEFVDANWKSVANTIRDYTLGNSTGNGIYDVKELIPNGVIGTVSDDGFSLKNIGNNMTGMTHWIGNVQMDAGAIFTKLLVGPNDMSQDPPTSKNLSELIDEDEASDSPELPSLLPGYSLTWDNFNIALELDYTNVGTTEKFTMGDHLKRMLDGSVTGGNLEIPKPDGTGTQTAASVVDQYFGKAPVEKWSNDPLYVFKFGFTQSKYLGTPGPQYNELLGKVYEQASNIESWPSQADAIKHVHPVSAITFSASNATKETFWHYQDFISWGKAVNDINILKVTDADGNESTLVDYLNTTYPLSDARTKDEIDTNDKKPTDEDKTRKKRDGVDSKKKKKKDESSTDTGLVPVYTIPATAPVVLC